jgi:hypothetical protein
VVVVLVVLVVVVVVVPRKQIETPTSPTVVPENAG